MCGQHNARASTGDNTGQNTDKGHTPNPRIRIKIPDPAAATDLLTKIMNQKSLC